MSKIVTVIKWIVLIAVALFFVKAGYPKVIGEQAAVDGFRNMGFPVWFLYLIGVLEAGGGIALLIPKVTRYAAAVLAIVMIGAIITLIVNGGFAELGTPIVLLVILLIATVWPKPAQGRSFSA